MNQKWYIDTAGVRVKPCSRCKSPFPYTLEFFSSRGEGKFSAYCRPCEKARGREYQKSHKKTRQVRVTAPLDIVDGVPYKKCNSCGKRIPHTFENFDRTSGGQNGLRAECRICRLEKNHKFAERRWAYQLFNNARASTKRSGLPTMDITEEVVLSIFERQCGRCYWLGVEMIPSQKTKSPFQPSLDRLDRSRGYTKDNVVLCCFVANFGRNSSSVSEFTEFLNHLEKEMSFSQWK